MMKKYHDNLLRQPREPFHGGWARDRIDDAQRSHLQVNRRMLYDAHVRVRVIEAENLTGLVCEYLHDWLTKRQSTTRRSCLVVICYGSPLLMICAVAR